jgi:Domain of unknown function (DUF4331)
MDPNPRSVPRRLLAGLGIGAILVTTSAVIAPTVSLASSHREAPLISGDPRADNTDTYAFVSPDKPSTVTLIANWYPFEEPNGGPNFYPFATHARYNIKIDNNGDGAADITYTWKFTDHVRNAAGQFLLNTGVVKNITDPTLNTYQTYNLTVSKNGTTHTLLSNRLVAPSDSGPASMPHYGALRTQALKQGVFTGGRSFVGQADDPFFLDLRVFDLLYGGNLTETGHDTLDGYNVNTIAIQVPKKVLALKGAPSRNPVIGVWSTTERRAVVKYTSTGATVSGPWVQISRLGNPLVNEVVVPLKFKDAFNGLRPFQDHTVAPVVAKVKDPIVPHLIQSIYGVPAPAAPRNDLVEIFLTGICKACGPIKADLNSQLLNKDVKASAFVPAEELRLNMAVAPTAKPNRLGVLGGDLAGFPNGRRLKDDVVDIAVQSMEGAAQSGHLVAALAKGDGVNHNDVGFGAAFPYVALPHHASVNTSSPAGSSGAAYAARSGGDGGPFTGGRAPVTYSALGVAALAIAMAFATARRRRTAFAA